MYVFGKCQQALTQLHCQVSILEAICTCLMLYAHSPSPCGPIRACAAYGSGVGQIFSTY